MDRYKLSYSANKVNELLKKVENGGVNALTIIVNNSSYALSGDSITLPNYSTAFPIYTASQAGLFLQVDESGNLKWGIATTQNGIQQIDFNGQTYTGSVVSLPKELPSFTVAEAQKFLQVNNNGFLVWASVSQGGDGIKQINLNGISYFGSIVELPNYPSVYSKITELTDYSTVFTPLQSSVNTIYGQVSSINSQVSSISSQIDSINSQVNNLNGQISSINSDILSIYGRVSSIEEVIPPTATISNPLVALDTTNALHSSIVSLDTKVQQLSLNYSTLYSWVSSQAVRIDNLNSNIITINSSIVSINSSIASINSAIGSLSTSMITVFGSVSSLSSSMTSVIADISTLSTGKEDAANKISVISLTSSASAHYPNEPAVINFVASNISAVTESLTSYVDNAIDAAILQALQADY